MEPTKESSNDNERPNAGPIGGRSATSEMGATLISDLAESNARCVWAQFCWYNFSQCYYRLKNAFGLENAQKCKAHALNTEVPASAHLNTAEFSFFYQFDMPKLTTL